MNIDHTPPNKYTPIVSNLNSFHRQPQRSHARDIRDWQAGVLAQAMEDVVAALLKSQPLSQCEGRKS